MGSLIISARPVIASEAVLSRYPCRIGNRQAEYGLIKEHSNSITQGMQEDFFQDRGSQSAGHNNNLPGLENQHVKGHDKNAVAAKTSASAIGPRKRKSDDVEEIVPPQDLHEVDDNDPRLYAINENCDQVGDKIYSFIDSGLMKIGKFETAIGVSPDAYRNFMRHEGPHGGKDCDTYLKAFTFFKKREATGSQHLEAEDSAETADERKPHPAALDVSGVELDGEDEHKAPVYATCDEVREKIQAVLCEPDVTQAALLRAIAESFPAAEDRKIQTNQLHAFLEKEGPMAGNTSSVFYGAYVLFEKLRVKEGKVKSEARLEMERIHPEGVNVTEIQK
ncbi:hypothetical protein F4778DRAFT_785466 [Xylariomycetidae sp. FL2044]|nr:hypothetical protein F4778DRAFT_785466 [Xylariomycetidae sp. FL2044]